MRGLTGFILATIVPTVFLSFASVIVILISCVVGNEKQILPFVGAIWSTSFLVMLAAAFGYLGDKLLEFAHYTTEGACRMTVRLFGSDHVSACKSNSNTNAMLFLEQEQTRKAHRGDHPWSI